MTSRSNFRFSWFRRLLFVVACCAVGGLGSSVQGRTAPAVRIDRFEIGFHGAYKLGCWTQVQIGIAADAAIAGVVEVVATDSEGIPVTISTPPEAPLKLAPGKPATARLIIRPGQEAAPFSVRFRGVDGRVLASRGFDPGAAADVAAGLPPTARLVVTLGSERGVGDLVQAESSADAASATRAVQLPSADSLPEQWYGYEGVDLVILSTAQAELFAGLAADDPRVAALQRWIELGGRLAIFAGADAPHLLQPDGPLSELLPGRFEGVVPLREAQPIETFSGTATVIDPTRAGASTAIVSGQQFQLPTPRLVDVRGRILAFGGPSPTDLPLVIREDVGLGEITFVAVNPDAPPLGDWAGRINLLRQSLQWPASAPGADARANAFSYSEDLMDRLRRALDSSLAGVGTAPFGWIALAVVIYVAFIGPGDFFLLKRLLKRMQLTWLSFPLVAALVSAGAYWVSHRIKGSELRVNQVEIVDVHLGAREARGTVWTHFYSPRVSRRDLRLTPRFGGRDISSPRDMAVGWIGSTGFGLDGMQGRRGQAGLFDRGYAISPTLSEIDDLPMRQWSSRTITARWTAPLEPPLEAGLTAVSDNLLAGRIANRAGLPLHDCVLMHANWAYALGSLPDGAELTIDRTRQPRTVRTVLTLENGSRRDASPRLHPIEATVPQIVTAMMFYEAVGGRGYAQAAHRYQSFVDLSRVLHGEHAILLARVDTAGSGWKCGTGALASERDAHWVYYRFAIPLRKEQAVQGPAPPP